LTAVILENSVPVNQFAFSPSVGNSGGLIIIWNGTALTTNIISQSFHHIIVEFKCNISSKTSYLSNIYAPCNADGREEFVQWFSSLDSSANGLRIIMGDFNMIRSYMDRNRPGGSPNIMLLFNSLIQQHDLEEIPLKGKNFTWSNMQDNPA
jgi:hypothetical protein